MRQIQIYILSVIILATFFCVSCEKDDKNGKLDGNWQLTEWKDTQGIIKADKSSSIFYTVKLDLIQIQQNNPSSARFLNRFSYFADSLIITKVYVNIGNRDSLVTYKEIESFGVPSDGRFHINSLTSDYMELIGLSGILKFRKY